MEFKTDESDFQIELYLKPHVHDCAVAPYFWNLKRFSGTAWCSEGSGWAPTVNEAFEDALAYYKSHKE